LTLRSFCYDNRGMNLDEYLSQPGSMSATELARLLSVNPDQVRQWRHRYEGRVPSPANCVLIEKATQGAVTRKDLRPDDWRDNWPELDAADPPKQPKAVPRAEPVDAPVASDAPRPAVDAPAGPTFMLGDRRVRSGPNRGRRDEDRREHSS
jgi:DNA-binding transcriptional regulator YdaS (Cro superfamily)